MNDRLNLNFQIVVVSPIRPRWNFWTPRKQRNSKNKSGNSFGGHPVFVCCSACFEYPPLFCFWQLPLANQIKLNFNLILAQLQTELDSLLCTTASCYHEVPSFLSKPQPNLNTMVGFYTKNYITTTTHPHKLNISIISAVTDLILVKL